MEQPRARPCLPHARLHHRFHGTADAGTSMTTSLPASIAPIPTQSAHGVTARASRRIGVPAPRPACLVRRQRIRILYDRRWRWPRRRDRRDRHGPAAGGGPLLYGGPWVAERTAAIAGTARDNPGRHRSETVRSVVKRRARTISAVDVQRHLPACRTQRGWRTDVGRVDLLALPTHRHHLSRGGTARRADRAQQPLGALHQFREPARHGGGRGPCGPRSQRTSASASR
jgi:hypothetical protein